MIDARIRVAAFGLAGLLASAGLVPGGAGSAFAQAAAGSMSAAVAPIEALQTALAASDASKAAFSARAAALAPAVDRALDLPVILKNSVGLSYASIPPDKQAALLAVFRQFTIASYASNFSGSGDRFTVSPNVRQSGADTIVQTVLTGPDGGSTRIDYVMRADATGAEKAVDVLLDGTISRVAVQRSDFRSVIDSGGADALIARLKAKINTLSNGQMQP